jgi:outer membrane protein
MLGAFFLLAALAAPLKAQETKIAYTDLELVLSYMPEAKQVEQELRTYESNLMQQLQVKYDYLQTKVEEFREKQKSGELTQSEQQQKRKEIQKLNKEVRSTQQDAQTKLMKKRNKLIAPLVEDIKKAIDTVADRQGYTYVVNSAVAGTSVLLHYPEDHDITRKVLKELGIDPPENLEQGGKNVDLAPGGGAGTGGGQIAPGGGAPAGGGGAGGGAGGSMGRPRR